MRGKVNCFNLFVNSFSLQCSLCYLTMYKYTYLLSDSYRQKTTLTLTTNKKLQQNRTPAFDKGITPLNCQLRHKNYQSVKGFDFKNQDVNLSSVFKEYLTKLYEKSKQRSISSAYDPQMSVQDRIQRLNDLSDRHQQALREVELQNKLKEITNKYANKRRPLQTQYFHSKRQLGGNKIPAQRKLPQHDSNLLMKNKSTIYQPKFDRNQFNYRKQQQNKSISSVHQSNNAQEQTNKAEAVSKLASLQERIRLSIDKLH